MQHNRIIVIGSYLVALVMDTKRIPVEGETVLAKNFRQVHGGKGSNQAVQAARLNAPVTFIGFVGNDSYGKAFIELCKAENIDAAKVMQSSEFPTGAGFIICSAAGQNIITIDIGANNEMNAKAIDELTVDIKQGDIVLIQLEIPLEAAMYAAAVAKKKGAIVILNPAPAADLSNRNLCDIDYITPNESEAKICCGLQGNSSVTNEEAAGKLLALGCKNVIITLGEKGCLILNDKDCCLLPAFNLPAIVDSTGAGDSFNAALAVALLEDKTIINACVFANAVAGLACTKPDTITSYHNRNEVQQFILDHSS
jgi:ribokinase